jgi:tetratricopeptide (TPR) repeat protein
MARPLTTIVAVLALASLFIPESEAFIGDLLNRSDRQVLDASQLSSQESAAAAQVARARQLEADGRRRQARDIYRSVVRSYPRTDSAAEARFAYAGILQEEGDGRKAFEQYQELITLHRNTPKFNEAIEQQFKIADELKHSDRKGFLGIGAAIQPSKLIEMYDQIVESAPHSEFAPRSLLNKGIVQAREAQMVEAIATLQRVVDSYQGTSYAAEAQYEIFRLRGVRASRSNNPVEDRAQVEAGLDFLNQNPDDQRSQKIQSNLQAIEESEMEKKYNIGMFYERSGRPDSARVYYRDVVANPNTSWAPKAQERLNALDSAPSSGSSGSRRGLFGLRPSGSESDADAGNDARSGESP